MPIYEFECNECKFTVEKIQAFDIGSPVCKCGGAMRRLFSPIAFVNMNGSPSFRKQWLGTAPYTTRGTSPKVDDLGRTKGWPGDRDPESIIQGKKWLESLE